MKSFFDKIVSKIKSLDKKVLIGICAGIVAVIVIVVALIIGLSGNDEDNNKVDKETKAETELETEADTEEETEEAEETEEPEDSDETEEEETTEEAEETEAIETDAPYTEPETQASQYLTGPGSAEEHLLQIPTAEMTVTTVSIPAGVSVHYDIYRVGGMIFTLNSYNAYVVYNGVRYDAYNGVVTFQIENALASDSIYFEIGNKGVAEESFFIQFTSPLGTYANPQIVNTMNTDYSISLPEGTEIGYYYKYYAEQTGTIRFYMTASSDSIFVVTNNRNSAQRTSEGDVKTDEQGREYVEIEVNQGDELLINLGAIPNKRGKYPAVDITWVGKYN